MADLVALMESSDLPPWRRDWSGHNGEHRNLETGQPYRGANPILLELGGMLRGHTLPLWIGGSQAKAHGWFPRKGSKAVRIVRPQLNRRELTGDDGQVLLLPDGSPSIAAWVSYKPVAVFNAADLVGTDDSAQQLLQERIKEAIGQQDQKEPQARLEAAGPAGSRRGDPLRLARTDQLGRRPRLLQPPARSDPHASSRGLHQPGGVLRHLGARAGPQHRPRQPPGPPYGRQLREQCLRQGGTGGGACRRSDLLPPTDRLPAREPCRLPQELGAAAEGTAAEPVQGAQRRPAGR